MVIDETDVIDAAPVKSKHLELAAILDPDAGNLALMLDDNRLTMIGQNVIRDVDLDLASRKDWIDRHDRALDIAMQVKKEKAFPWVGASNVKYPVLTTAVTQFQARALPAIVDNSNLVKGRVLGPDPDGTKRMRADRIGGHMTWQLLYKMKGWEEDTDKLLGMLPIIGSVFRKTYYDPISASNRSVMVPAKDFIVDYWATSLDSAPRYTHRLQLYPYEVQERVAAGLWREISIDSDGTSQDDDAHVDFYEQHRMIDLDNDGYPEPYVVTTNLQGQVARIVPCFGFADVTVRGGNDDKPVKMSKLADADRFDLVGDVIRIERRSYFSHYMFIPSPDGSFYGMGFGTLLDDITGTVDRILNQMIDAGALQNAQGGFLGSGVNMKGGPARFALGEWKRVDTTAGTLRDNIMPLQLPGPSAVLFNLLGMLIEAAKEITSVQNVLTGEGTANQPATTTLALIEQGQKVMTAIFKRIHRAFGDELQILRRLNRDYLDEQEYFQLNDAPEAQSVERADYEDDDLDVVPVSDPTAVSDMQKLARAEASSRFIGDPLVNQKVLRQRYFEAIGERNIKELMTVEGPATPDPRLIIEGMKQALEKVIGEATVRAKDAQSSKVLADAAAVLHSLNLIDDAANLAGAAAAIGGQTDDALHGTSEPPAGAGDAAAMEGPPADGGVPGISPDAPPPVDAGVGEGAIAGPGDTGAGGPAGEAGGPVA